MELGGFASHTKQPAAEFAATSPVIGRMVHHLLQLDNPLDRQTRSPKLSPCFVDLGGWSSAVPTTGSLSVFDSKEFHYRPAADLPSPALCEYEFGYRRTKGRIIHGKDPTADGLEWALFWNGFWGLLCP